MKFMDRLLGISKATRDIENHFEQELRSINTSYSGDITGGSFDVITNYGQTTATGITVNQKTAMELTGVGAAVRIISETVASLPFSLYQRKKENTREQAKEHPVYKLLHDEPNPFMTAFTFRELLQSHVLLWGNAYAEIEWDKKGQVKALWPLRPDRVEPYVNKDLNELWYAVKLQEGEIVSLPADRILHIQALGDGIKGDSLIKQHREALGLAKATEKYGSKFFGNGARPGGVIEHPGTLTQDAQKRLLSGWTAMHGGLDNSHRTAVLEEGMTYKQIGLPPEDSQFLQTRKFQMAEIARIFRVPLHMLAELDRSTNNNIEHQGIEFLTHTIRPWLVRWEQSCNTRLLINKERNLYYAEHVTDALLRGDTKSRYEAYQIARQNGWLSANDIRAKENMNPISDDEGGNAYLVNSAMQPISILLKGGVDNGEGSQIEGGQQGSAPTNSED